MPIDEVPVDPAAPQVEAHLPPGARTPCARCSWSISAFMIGPIAEFWLIPSMEGESGRDTWGWLLGAGEARGIALVFLVSGLIMLVTVLLALASAPYRRLSKEYAVAPPQAIEA